MAVAGCTRQPSVQHLHGAGNVGLSVFRGAARAYSYPASGTAGRCVTTGAFASERWAGPVVPHTHFLSLASQWGSLLAAVVRWGKRVLLRLGEAKW